MWFAVLFQLFSCSTLTVFMFNVGDMDQEVSWWISNSKMDYSSYKALSKVSQSCGEEWWLQPCAVHMWAKILVRHVSSHFCFIAQVGSVTSVFVNHLLRTSCYFRRLFLYCVEFLHCYVRLSLFYCRYFTCEWFLSFFLFIIFALHVCFCRGLGGEAIRTYIVTVFLYILSNVDLKDSKRFTYSSHIRNLKFSFSEKCQTYVCVRDKCFVLIHEPWYRNLNWSSLICIRMWNAECECGTAYNISTAQRHVVAGLYSMKMTC